MCNRGRQSDRRLSIVDDIEIVIRVMDSWIIYDLI